MSATPRLGGPMSDEEYHALSDAEKAEDARLLADAAMGRRELMTPAEAGAYGRGIHEEPTE